MTTIYTHDGAFGASATGTRQWFRAALAPVWSDWHRDAGTTESLDDYIERLLDEHLVECGAEDLIGLSVDAGTGDDHDTGRIESVIDSTSVFVAWDSGVKAPAALSALTFR